MSALAAGELDRALAGTRFHGRCELHASLPSTIDRCRALADAGRPEGTAVLADEQRRGRGQRGRSWHSPRGLCLCLSALLRPGLSPEQAPELVKVAGLAALEALRDACGVEATLRRPNDLLLAEAGGRFRKLGGLLVDTAVQGPLLRHAIMSLGLNVGQEEEDFPAELRPWATSLRIATGHDGGRDELAAAFLRRLDAAASDIAAGGLAAWSRRWDETARELDGWDPPAWSREVTT